MVDPTDSTIIAMWADGATAGQIAKTIGYGRNMIMAHINNLTKKGEITNATRQSRIAAINARVEELERVRQGTNFEAQSISSFKAKKIPLLQLSHSSCRFIVEGTNMRNMSYCGHDKFKYSYCEHHYKLCYVPRQPKEQANDATA